MEVIGILIAIVGVGIAYQTYKKQFHSKPTEELDHLKVQFRTTQKLSLEVQKELEELVSAHNAYDSIMYPPSMTYGACLAQMKSEYKTNLSDEMYDNLMSGSSDYTKSNIDAFTKMLETQSNALLQMRTETRVIARMMNGE